MRSVSCALSACVLMLAPLAVATAESSPQGPPREPCNCGGEDASSRATSCICLFYEYAIYIPPDPDMDIVYYYYGMFCNSDFAGTCQYADVIRRPTGTNTCTTQNGTIICPTDRREQSNCFWPIGMKQGPMDVQRPASRKTPLPFPHPSLGRRPAKKVGPRENCVTLMPYPDWPAEFVETQICKMKAGQKQIFVKLQKMRLQNLPGQEKELMLGVGRQCDAPALGEFAEVESVQPISPPDGGKKTYAVIASVNDFPYIVLLADPFPVSPTAAPK